MIGSKIKRRFIKKRLKKLQTSHNVNTSETRNGKIRSVGVLTTHKLYSQYNLRALVSECLDTKDIQIFSLTNAEKNQERSPESFSEADLNWRGEIKDESLQHFKERPFDLLICFYNRSSVYLDFIACSSSAKFKAGFEKKDTDYVDLSIQLDIGQVNEFFQELKKYLTILNKL